MKDPKKCGLIRLLENKTKLNKVVLHRAVHDLSEVLKFLMKPDGLVSLGVYSRVCLLKKIEKCLLVFFLKKV